MVWFQTVCSQQAKPADQEISYVDLVEGTFIYDQTLINGVQFYNQYLGCEGSPYFDNPDYIDGDLSIHKQVYKHVLLRYDLQAQQVEIEYGNLFGGYSWLITIVDHINSFRLGDFYFEKLDLDGSGSKFYQVIRTTEFTSYIHWEKKLLTTQGNRVYLYAFSDAKSSIWLEIDGDTNSIKNRKAFTKLCPENKQKEIIRFLKRKHFSFQNATPDEIVRTLNEVAKLLKTGGLS